MTENILTTNPDKSEPKYRKKLNEEQLAVLNLLYTFRFASNEHVAKYSGKKNNKEWEITEEGRCNRHQIQRWNSIKQGGERGVS